MKRESLRTLIILHLLFLLYSVGSICSKMASNYEVLSRPFVLFYGGLVLILGFYAIGWQQIIKKFPLTTAYANRAVTVVWGVVWGILFFDEKLTLKKIIGILFVVFGVIIFARSGQGDDHG